MSRPDYIDRDPPAARYYNQLLNDSTVVEDVPTRSRIATLPRPNAYVTTLAIEFENKKAEAVEAFNQIVSACESNGNKPFFDTSFFVGDRKNLYPDGSPDDCTVGEPQTVIRAEQFYGGAPLFDGSSNFDVDATDIRQNEIGSCFLVAAIASIANFSQRAAAELEREPDMAPVFSCEGHDPIKRIFVAHSTDVSVYTIMMYVGGSWEWVIIDGTLPGTDYESPIFATCGQENKELWGPLLEKAYAKLFFSYDSIDGGRASTAMATLTGGITNYRDVDAMSWGEFYSLGTNPLNLLSCAVRHNVNLEAEAGNVGHSGEQGTSCGLYQGHAYSVLSVRETQDRRLKLVKARNPWGSGEYKGPFADSDPFWPSHPKYATELSWSNEEDGEFYMDAATFRRLMEVDLVNIFPDTHEVLTMSSRFGSTGSAEDDTYVFHADKPGHFRFIVGQYDRRTAPALLGQSRQAHRILKGYETWDQMSDKIGLRVFHHPRGAPKSGTFATSPYKDQMAAIVGYGDSWMVDLPDCPAGFISVVPIINKGTPYYVRCVAPPEANASLYRLSQGPESGCGRVEAVVVEEEPDPEPGTELEIPIFEEIITTDNQQVDNNDYFEFESDDDEEEEEEDVEQEEHGDDDDQDYYDEEEEEEEEAQEQEPYQPTPPVVTPTPAPANDGWSVDLTNYNDIPDNGVEDLEAYFAEHPDDARPVIGFPRRGGGRFGGRGHARRMTGFGPRGFGGGKNGRRARNNARRQGHGVQLKPSGIRRGGQGRRGDGNRPRRNNNRGGRGGRRQGRGGGRQGGRGGRKNGGGRRHAAPSGNRPEFGNLHEQNLRMMFAQFDFDGNGSLDRSESMAALVHFFPHDSPSLISARIRQADANRDGKLDFREFCAIALDACGQGQPEATYQQQQGGGGNGRGRRGGGGGSGRGRRR